MSDRSPTPDDARRMVMEPSNLDLWHIAHTLDRGGASFIGDVPAALVADMLEVGEPENWPRTTREVTSIGQTFTPYRLAR